MINCYICGKPLYTNREIAMHFSYVHKMNKDEYKKELLKIYPELFICCKNCGIKIPKYKNEGGCDCCSDKCKKELLVKKNTGRVQSEETIRKRIRNTDQTKKEQTRQNTMIERYDSLYNPFNPEERNKKLSEALAGRKHTKEHHEKVTESKRKNGTLKHKQSTKDNISKILLAYYSNEDIDHSVTLPKKPTGSGLKGKFECGEINGIYYRSSYEKIFLHLCDKYNIAVETAATKEFRVRYEYEGKMHWYYPDFFLTDFGVVVEIKPINLLGFNENPNKIHHGMIKHSFWLVTEEELEEKSFYEHISSF